ncbi:hypothetical protein [Pseudomonas phage PIP]|nr:hypothetical protein [Pseudomonas phage PIP]
MSNGKDCEQCVVRVCPAARWRIASVALGDADHVLHCAGSGALLSSAPSSTFATRTVSQAGSVAW